MDRNREVENIRRMAADLIDNDRMGRQPGQSAEQYADDLLSMADTSGLDRHDKGLLRRFLVELAS